MIDLKATIEGDQNLNIKLDHLSRAGQQRAMRSALAVGQTRFRKAIRDHIWNAKTPGHSNDDFRDAVGSRFVSSRSQGLTQAKTGINVGKRKSKTKQTTNIRRSLKAVHRKRSALGKGAPHFHLLALGTAVRRTNFGANRGRIAKSNIVPEAVASVQSSAGVAMENKLRERIYAEALKGR